jgi:hypothetical protein
MIPEVAGDMDAHAIAKSLEEKCNAEVLKADAASMGTPTIAKLELMANVEL